MVYVQQACNAIYTEKWLSPLYYLTTHWVRFEHIEPISGIRDFMKGVLL